MRTRIAFLLAAALMAVFVSPSRVHAQSNVVTLVLERSTNGLSGWQTVQVTTNSVPASVNAFYRMRITALPPATNNMITVQGGTLPQNSQLAGTVVATFQIGKFEVTWDEWQGVRAWGISNGYSDLAAVGAGSGQNHPVRHVSWYDVVKWINAKSQKDGFTPVYQAAGAVYRTGQSVPTINSSANGYRLPTAAEWEWAARGGLNSQGFLYSGSNDLNAVGWYADNSSGAAVDMDSDIGSDRGTWPVGAKAANELGIHDMSGNTWEWIYDAIDPMRRIGGGSWAASAYDCIVALLDFGNDPSERSSVIGFRLTRNAP